MGRKICTRSGTKPISLPMSPLETLSFPFGKFMVQLFPVAETPKDVYGTASCKLKLFQKQNGKNPFSTFPNDTESGGVSELQNH